jgi:hypothetical protein
MIEKAEDKLDLHTIKEYNKSKDIKIQKGNLL